MSNADPTPAARRRVRALFDEAVALPAIERERFLNRLGRDDEELRDELGELLAAHDRATGFLDAPPGGSPPPAPTLNG